MFEIFKRRSSQPEQLFFHTDLHCHLVPGIDDGQRRADTASELVEREKSWGIRRIITTPHVTQDTFENTPEIINAAFAELQKAVRERGVEGVELLHSAEYRLDGFFNEQLEAGNINPMPNGYLLVENSFVQEAWDIDRRLFDLKLKGFRPVLAHPERYIYYFDNPRRYRQLHDAGTLFQVNLLSLAGHYGKEIKKRAEDLIEQGMVDFIGTDMHNHRHAEAIDAYIGSRDFRRHAKALEGKILNDTAFG